MEKLMELGFEVAADVVFANSPSNTDIEIQINKYRDEQNILYAIIFHSQQDEDDLSLKTEVVYIGHTRKTFRNRMNGYQSGAGNAVNNRVNTEIKKFLSCGGRVEVMVLLNDQGLQMYGIDVDMAAGLEYSLIYFYCCYNRDNNCRPLLNIAGNNCVKKAKRLTDGDEINQAKEDYEEENADYPPPVLPDRDVEQLGLISDNCESLPCRFEFYLTQRVYWPIPVFNVPVNCERHFGLHGSLMNIELSGNNAVTLQVRVNRTANKNGTPRIYFAGNNGGVYTAWKQANHVVGDMVTVVVLATNHIKIS